MLCRSDPMLYCPDPWIEIDGKRIYGDKLTQYHREHRTSSYHCTRCGASNWSADQVYPCWNCGYCGHKGKNKSRNVSVKKKGKERRRD